MIVCRFNLDYEPQSRLVRQPEVINNCAKLKLKVESIALPATMTDASARIFSSGSFYGKGKR